MSTLESAAESSTRKASGLAALPMKTVGMVGFVLGALLTAVGTFTDFTDNDNGTNELGTWVFVVAILAVSALLVYRFWYGPAAAADEAPNSALIGGAVALLIAVPGFWTGLPSVFAMGAIVLGLRSSGAKPKIGIALSVVALAVCALLAIVG